MKQNQPSKQTTKQQQQQNATLAGQECYCRTTQPGQNIFSLLSNTDQGDFKQLFLDPF